MPPSEIYTAFEQKLVSARKEQLKIVAENLLIGFLFVPSVMPTENYMGILMPTKKFNGAIALTSHRIIISWEETRQCVRTLHARSINNISERPLRSDKPNWQYQSIIMLSGGLVLIAQTQLPNIEQANRLSALLNEAIVCFGAPQDDTGSIAAIIAYEEEKKKSSNNQDNDSDKKKDD
jgi:hypothetical protein